MSAYVLFQNLGVHDAETFAAYRERVGETVTRHGGRYLVIGGAVSSLEGEWSIASPVMIEFPSEDAARRWYTSAEYAPLKAMRVASMDSVGILIGGAS